MTHHKNPDEQLQYCLECGQTIPPRRPGKRPGRRRAYCSNRCKQRAYRQRQRQKSEQERATTDPGPEPAAGECPPSASRHAGSEPSPPLAEARSQEPTQ